MRFTNTGDDETDPVTERIADRSGSTRRNFLVVSALIGAGAAGGIGTVGADGHDDAGGDAQAELDDEGILNFARTLEFLEARFYREGLDGIGEEDLRTSDPVEAVGGSVQDRVYDDLRVIQEHEETHIEVLGDTIESLGGDPVAEPTFDFGTATEDPTEFLATAAVLETTGVGAYAGAAPLIDNPDLIPPALSIHSVEARHASFLNVVNEEIGFPDAFDEALTVEEVLERAGPFIVEDGGGEPDPIGSHWQIDFGAGEMPPDPPRYWPDDVMAALGNSEDGVASNPSHRRQESDGQLGDVAITDQAFEFDDDDMPTEVSVSFEVAADGDPRYLHLAAFSTPGPYGETDIDEQELVDVVSGEFSGGDSDTLSLGLD